MRRPNYIPDENPFQLAAPPIWWLEELRGFDSELVVLPSRQIYQYRMGRRSKRAPRLLQGKLPHPLVAALPQPDTIMFATYGLIPVAPLPGNTIFDRRIFTELRSRDIWHHGGAAKAADLLDEHDRRERQLLERRVRSEIEARSSDYWDSLHYRSGSRVSMAHTLRPSTTLKVVDRRRPLKFDS